MSEQKNKKNPTIGCCGIDCGLCPRYYTEGKTRCPGCFGENFIQVMGQSCSLISCCFKVKKFETCGKCNDFPCEKFNNEWFGENAYDSFVTHKKAMSNLYFIKSHGFKEFLRQQKKRMQYLNIFLGQFNEGRSKNLFCLSSAILSINGLKESLDCAKREIEKKGILKNDLKSKAKILKKCLFKIADEESIELKLNKPSHWK